jgi:hypothetical protein
MEFAFRYEPEHLRLYQRLASHRVEAKNTDYVAAWWGWMLGYTFVAGAALACAYLVFPALTGRPFALLEFFCGFVGGVGVVYAMSWRRYRRLSGKAVRPDGPTLAEHHVVVAEDGLRSTSRQVDHVYRWAAFEDVTVYGGVIVLWTEPGAGALVPRSAFADPAAETAFVDAVRSGIASAQGKAGTSG